MTHRIPLEYEDSLPCWRVTVEDPEVFREVGHALRIRLFCMPGGALLAIWLRLFDLPDQPYFVHRVLDLSDSRVASYVSAWSESGALLLRLVDPAESGEVRRALFLEGIRPGDLLEIARPHNHATDLDGEYALEAFLWYFQPRADVGRIDEGWAAVDRALASDLVPPPPLGGREVLLDAAAEEESLAFETVSRELVTCLLPEREDIERASPEAQVLRHDLPGTLTTLVLLQEGGVRLLPRRQVMGWEQSDDELFRLGLENLRERYPPSVQDRGGPGERRLRELSDEHPFVASFALELSALPGCTGELGSLVALPSARVLLCHPLEAGEDVLEAVAHLAEAAAEARDEEFPLLDQEVLWFHQGRYTLIGVRRTAGAPLIQLPAELASLVGG